MAYEATDALEVEVADFARSGTPAGNIPVQISYGIIERFSEGLYSSPNKTFEELVTNSYDAGAERVWVHLAADLAAAGASIVVIDDGESMDFAGLEDLWQIGESKKRTESPPPGRARPVGKFGIGKLATYVLARELTYVVHRDQRYFAVTMDYEKVSSESHELLRGVDLSLQVVEMERPAALGAVEKALGPVTGGEATLDLLSGSGAPPHWTAAVLTRLKQAAEDIEQGRLRWVLRTALPLNPAFTLFYNEEELSSSKATGDVTWSFDVGRNEDQLPTPADGKPWYQAPTVSATDTEGKEVVALQLPVAGRVWGKARLFEKPLRGKSRALGRSHGYFVRVRGRLINLESDDFDVGPELRHGTLTRFHMEVNADDLDDEVASTRENLKDSSELTELKAYILAVFNRARAVVADEDADDHMPLLSKDGRLSDPPAALSQGPLRRMLHRAASGDLSARESLNLDDEAAADAVHLLEEGSDLLAKVVIDDLGDSNRLVGFDPGRRAAVLNQSHPFVTNYLESKNVAEAMKLFGLTELLTQAYLLDEEVPGDIVTRVMRRRDAFLRALAHRHPRSAHVVARYLRDNGNDQKGLEDAVGDALEILGFEVRRLGGTSHGPDGVGTARLGLRLGDRTDSYAFTYEAKSKGARDLLIEAAELAEAGPVAEPGQAQRIRADTARTSVLRVHREEAIRAHHLDVEPYFTLLVAPGFQGEDADDALIHKVCLNDGITAITVENLARVVELFPVAGLTPLDLKGLFDRRGPAQTNDWVEERQSAVREPRPPVSKLVEVLVRYSEGRQPTNISALGAYLRTEDHDLSEAQVSALVRGLQALAPKSIYVDEGIVALNATPAALFREMRETLDHYDAEVVGPYVASMPEEEP